MKQAMIFAAGLGTRLRPLTDTMPKALVPVGGMPLLAHVVEKLKRAGFTRIVVNVHHFAQQIVDYISANDRFAMDIAVSDESGALLDTGGGLRHARSLFEPTAPVLVHNVDILSNADLASVYATADASGADALLLVSQRSSSRALLFSGSEPPALPRLVGWQNLTTGELRGPIASGQPSSPAPLAYAFSGIHVVAPRLLASMDAWPERFGIIDFYLDACATGNILGLPQPDLHLLDVGKLDTLAAADAFVQQEAS